MDTEIGTEIKQQALLAFKALQEHSEQKRKKLLFPETDASVYFMVKLKKAPLSKGSSLRKFISLPCPDRNPSNSSICLILPDLDRSAKAARDPDVDKQAREWSELFYDKYGLTQKQISKIFTITQLRREYSQHADRCKLANTYDIFMVDKKLMKMAFYHLGSNFRKPEKMPLPIDASKDITKSLQQAYSLVQLDLAPLKEGIRVRIGNLGQPIADLESNLSVIVDSMLQHCPGGPMNIRSGYIQTFATELTLPVFVDFGSANDVHMERPKRLEYAVEQGECSTLPDGLTVKVRADGEVTVLEEKSGEEVLYPTEQDEWEREDDIGPLRGKVLERVLQKKAKHLARAQRQQKKKKKGTAAEKTNKKNEEESEKVEECTKKEEDEGKKVAKKRKKEQQQKEEEEMMEQRPKQMEKEKRKEKKQQQQKNTRKRRRNSEVEEAEKEDV